MTSLCEALNLQPVRSLDELISEGKTLLDQNPKVEVLVWNLAVALEKLLGSLTKVQEAHPDIRESQAWQQVLKAAQLPIQQSAIESPDDLWAEWPDGFMCPMDEVEDCMMPPFARSDDYALVRVSEYDESDHPGKWEYLSSVKAIVPT